MVEQTRVRREHRELRTGVWKIRRSGIDRGRFRERKEKSREMEGGGSEKNEKHKRWFVRLFPLDA